MQGKVFERLKQYYRCPEHIARFGREDFGFDTGGRGKYPGTHAHELPEGGLKDALRNVRTEGGIVQLPFDPAEVAESLLFELYVGDWRKRWGVSVLADLYYLVRPFLSVGVRRLFQRIHLAGWERIPFPNWPVDFSVDDLYGELLVTSLRTSGIERIPFIWFWPDGASSCALMTHDVETEAGGDFCRTLMDIDDSFGIKSSFQIVPEERYRPVELSSSIRARGFEVCIHDLNHDGHLYRSREEFLSRAERINAYGKEYGAGGFRSGVLYRKQLWFDALDFSYDMSVPNVAHLDPQRGGCCTVMPYFIGEILEIPVTTTQDYTLFHILGEYSDSLWRRQIGLIMAKHGLMSFIVHPDYIMKEREQSLYKALLAHLDHLRTTQGVWIAPPAELNRWWRQRAAMGLEKEGDEWRIGGEGSEHAQVAFACLEEGQLSIELPSRGGRKPCPVGQSA